MSDVANGPLADTGISEGIVWGDWDGDGDHDLYLSKKQGANRLLRNDVGDSFADVTSGPIGDESDGEGIAWGDYDNDGGNSFRNRAAAAGVVSPGASRGVVWGDYDGDNDLDLYVTRSHRSWRARGPRRQSAEYEVG